MTKDSKEVAEQSKPRGFKAFRVEATMTYSYFAYFEAENEDEAYEMGRAKPSFEYLLDDDMGHWEVLDDVEEVSVAKKIDVTNNDIEIERGGITWDSKAVNKKFGPYTYDEIVEAMNTIIDELWDRWDAAASPLPISLRSHRIDKDRKKFNALRTLKYLVNQAAANRNLYDWAGHCPNCGGNDGYFNIGRKHYFYCLLCKSMWMRGSNLFSSWRNEDDDIWARNATEFNAFDLVEPVLDWSRGKEVQQ